MTFTDTATRRAVGIFDPTKPWKDQTIDLLPAPAGDGSFLDGVALEWSPSGGQLAGTVNGVVTIYDMASRTYRPVGDVRGAVYAWLEDGRVLVGPANAPRLVDPATGAARAIAVPRFGAERPAGYQLTRDERFAYFNLATTESDVWLVGLVKPLGGVR